jgi:hypothetical protein
VISLARPAFPPIRGQRPPRFPQAIALCLFYPLSLRERVRVRGIESDFFLKNRLEQEARKIEKDQAKEKIPFFIPSPPPSPAGKGRPGAPRTTVCDWKGHSGAPGMTVCDWRGRNHIARLPCRFPPLSYSRATPSPPPSRHCPPAPASPLPSGIKASFLKFASTSTLRLRPGSANGSGRAVNRKMR